MNEPTASDLIQEHTVLDDWCTAESKRFTDHLAPAKARQDEIKNKLNELMLGQGVNSLKTDHGTAYKSTIVTPKVVDRDAYLRAVLDKWTEFGNEMLQLSAPQKDAVTNYMEQHNGQLPPGVQTSSFSRINIRRS